VDQAVVGAEAYEVLWRRLFEYKFYEYASDLSAAWIWSRIRRIGRRAIVCFGEIGVSEGGSTTLLQAMKSAIESRGGEVRLKSPVARVVIEAGVVKGIEARAALGVRKGRQHGPRPMCRGSFLICRQIRCGHSAPGEILQSFA